MGKGRATILFKVSIDMNEETPNEIDLRMSKLKEVSSKSNGKTFLTLPDSNAIEYNICLLYTSPSPRDRQKSRMPSSA